MSTLPAERPHVVIVGGGIAGLSAAWYLQDHVHCTLLEASDRWGGKIYTERIDHPDAGKLKIELAADGFITRKPWALQLAEELGLGDRITGVRDLPERIYVLKNGEMVALPDGLSLLVPTKLWPFLRSPLFSLRGKLRMLLDTVLPRKRDDADESLAAFIRRRLGNEALERLAEPMLGGVYNADVEQMSILATFPNFRKIEAEHRSLILGMRRMMKGRSASPAQPALISFKGGMGELIDGLVERLTCDMYLKTRVESIEPQLEGGYNLLLDDDTPIFADYLVLATPANISARLLEYAAPEAAHYLEQFRYESVGSLTLAYRRADVPRALDAFGVVIPGIERRRIDGLSWHSSKWPGRVPDDVALIRVFFGGPNTRDMLENDDYTLLRIVRDELRNLMGISQPPLFHRLWRWEKAYPQYDVGHLERVVAIESALPEAVFVTGSSYRGVGLPDCIHAAKNTADQIIHLLNQRQEVL